jgi:hypothetical protein
VLRELEAWLKEQEYLLNSQWKRAELDKLPQMQGESRFLDRLKAHLADLSKTDKERK